MKTKLIVVLALVFVSVGGYFLYTSFPTSTSVSKSEKTQTTMSLDSISLDSIKVGDKMGDLTVKEPKISSIDNDYPVRSFTIKFSGETTLTGTYRYERDAILDCVWFYPDKESRTKMPNIKDFPEQNESFCLDASVRPEIKSLFGDQGIATIIIKDLIYFHQQKAGSNTAELVKRVK